MENISLITKRRLYQNAALWTFFTYLITAIHHFYTGILYQTMWRAEFAFYAIIPTIVCLVLLYFHYKMGGRVLIVVFTLVSFIFFFMVVGVWEGTWCHTTKLVCYSLGIPFHNAPASWNVPAAPTPKDLFSEATGVLNFLFALIDLNYMIKLLKGLHSPGLHAGCHGRYNENSKEGEISD